MPAERPRFSENPLEFELKSSGLVRPGVTLGRIVSTPKQQDWCAEQMANPEFRAEYAREVARMHQEAIEQRDPELARWCMRERARVDSTDSTR